MEGVFGFDFGTTNSLISIIEGGRCISFLDSKLPHPSVVCYQGDEVIVGRKAKERLATSETGVIGNIVKSPKSLLGESKVFVEGVSKDPKSIVADIVRYVRNHAIEQEPGEYDSAVVTIPVDMNGKQRKELREAFRISGINIIQFIHEPLAALYGHLRSQDNFKQEVQKLNRELILVFDWGGGTLDLTLCQIVDGMLVQLSNDGSSNVGGDIIDEIIRNEIVRRYLNDQEITEDLPQQVDATQRLLDRAERSKIDLSKKDSVQVFIPDYFLTDKYDVDIEYTLHRAEVEEMIQDKVDEGIQRIHHLLSEARISPSSVALCLATGGMVNMPCIKSRLREIFGPQRLCISERGNTIISEGAAWVAHDKANLSLAKNIELLVAPHAFFPVIKAGAKMPREGEVQCTARLNLYCTDPRDGFAKLQIQSPKRPGRKIQATDERNMLDVISINVDDKAKPYFERLEFQLEVDENLILHASAKSLVKNDSDNLEIHNLEFGLDLTNTVEDEEPIEAYEPIGVISSVDNGISLRPNVVMQKNDSLIPGELLYSYNPEYFDTRRSPPEHQELEKLYYQPCSFCKRPSNHPLCNCAGLL